MSAEGLKELHRLHRELQQVQQELKRGPQQIRVRKQNIEKRAADLKSQQDKLKELKQLAANKNSDLQVKESKIEDLGGKLNAAKSNQEYEVFKRQIAADTAAKEVLETEILDTYERIDQQEQAVADAETDLAAARTEEQRYREEYAALEPDLLARQQQLQEALKQAEKIVPAKLMDQYRRLVQAHGADAMAEVHDKSCGVCFTQLAPQISVQVNTAAFVFCRACGRLLYKP